jgi:hypothetical protein
MNINLDIVNNLIKQYLPYKRKKTTKNWETFNCPVCHLNGEPSPDKSSKGAIIFTGPSFTYKCFRCKFRCHWRPGFNFNKKTEKFLRAIYIPQENIDQLKLKIIEFKEHEEELQLALSEYTETPVFETITLPRQSKKLNNVKEITEDYLSVCQYVLDRKLDRHIDKFITLRMNLNIFRNNRKDTCLIMNSYHLIDQP